MNIIPVMEKEESIVPSFGEEESEDDEVVVIQTTSVDENTEVGTSVTEVFVAKETDVGSQSSKIDGLMDAEDVLGPDHQDDPMTVEDAQLSDLKKEVPHIDCSASGGTEVVIDKKGKSSPLDRYHSEESESDQSKKKRKSEPGTVTGLRRSTRPKRKPLWQESGDYCMGIQKQSLMVQSNLTSGVWSELDPSIISAVVKGISETF